MKKIALVDDHKLVRASLAETINTFPGYRVLFEADNGKDFIRQLNPEELPWLVLLDVKMKEMNGFETALWIRDNYPQIKVLVLSMLDDKFTIIRMFHLGVHGYLLKCSPLEELGKALNEIRKKDIYINDALVRYFPEMLSRTAEPLNEYETVQSLSEREKDFLKWLCSERPLKEIAAEMHLSPRTIDGYRDNLFQKTQARSRSGLVLFAIRNKLIEL
ncbi:MAG TPA: response regulator transcription factor [Sediminibacterium sp.]|nr:response regulator transcription factor [Sediminibacterium sp.]